MKNKFNEKQGITLIALVVTIIVLLILAGISISMLTGQNGILNKASEAKEKTETAQTEEKIKIAVMSSMSENGNLIFSDLKSRLIDSGIMLDENINAFPVKISNDEKRYLINSTGEIIVQGENVPKDFTIGTMVSYIPKGTYALKSKYSGVGNSDIELDSSSDDFKIEKWKVLSIGNNNVTLVADSATTGKVELGNGQGYNNGVKLLNDICNNLYGDSKKKISARSINIKDLENYMTKEKLEEVYGYTNAVQYGKQVVEPYTSNIKYPKIYESEILSTINGVKKEKGLEKSEQIDFIEENSNNGIESATSIQPYQTYWTANAEFFKEAFINKSMDYYNILIKPLSSYWVASRSINTNSEYYSFDMRLIENGEIGATSMFSSKGARSDGKSVLPVISVSMDLIEESDNGYIIK